MPRGAAQTDDASWRLPYLPEFPEPCRCTGASESLGLRRPIEASSSIRYIRAAVGLPPASPLIARAIDVAEKHLGMEELSRRLATPEAIIQSWRMGRAAMPQSDFLRLIDVLTSLNVQWGEWNP